MGLFGKKKNWDIEKSDAAKGRLRELFNGVMEDGDSWNVLYGYAEDITNTNYVVARKTTHTYTSLIIGYRESDMSIAVIPTVPELDLCGEPRIFNKSSVKKAKRTMGVYTIYNQGGMTAGYTGFSIQDGNDEKFLAYVYQPEEYKKFDEFFKRFGGK